MSQPLDSLLRFSIDLLCGLRQLVNIFVSVYSPSYSKAYPKRTALPKGKSQETQFKANFLVVLKEVEVEGHWTCCVPGTKLTCASAEVTMSYVQGDLVAGTCSAQILIHLRQP